MGLKEIKDNTPLASLGVFLLKFDVKILEKQNKIIVPTSHIIINGEEKKFRLISTGIEKGKELWIVLFKEKLMFHNRGKGIALAHIHWNNSEMVGWKRKARNE